MLICKKQNGSPKDTTPDPSTASVCGGGGPVFLHQRRLSAFAEQLLETAPGHEMRYQDQPLLAAGDAA